MDYEKEYKEALERASKLRVQNPFDTVSQMMEYVFPKLAESEDEKVRKALIRFHKSTIDIDGIKGADIIAWLEKQGEQDMIRLDKAIKFLDEQLVNDIDEVTGEPFVNFQNYGAFKETFISFFKRKMLEKQSEKEQDPCEHCNDKLLNCHNFPCIKKRAFEQGKSILEVIKEEKVDNANKVEPKFKKE